MTDRPILFSGPMVRAILEGRKTQTRRVVKPQPTGFWNGTNLRSHTFVGLVTTESNTPRDHCWNSPYGQTGDRLWVRETWTIRNAGPRVSTKPEAWPNGWPQVTHVADCHPKDNIWNKRPSIFMPRWACRLVIEVTAVRVERLQQISEKDALAEGIKQWTGGRWKCAEQDGMAHESPAAAYRCLWDSLNAKRGFGWGLNPWVWVVEFKR